MVEKHDFLLEVGQQIKKIRLSKGINQAQLAELCDRDKQTIERIENGKINTSIFMLNIIANALNIKIKDLLDFKEK